MTEITPMGNGNRQGASPSGRFAVYFDDKAYIRKQIRNVIIGVACFGAFFLVQWMNHKIYPRFFVAGFLALPPVVILLDFLSHLAHHREYMGDDDAKKAYLVFDAHGVEVFHASSFSWDSIASVALITAAARGRGGKTSWLLLMFKDGEPLSRLTRRQSDRLTVDNSWVGVVAEKEYPVLKEENFVALRVAGGDALSSNLTASATEIEVRARKYLASAARRPDASAN